jgi:acetyltransferase-like isoleucine patch superfamily enzyme
MMTVLDNLFAVHRWPEFARMLWWRTAVPWHLRRMGVELGRASHYHGSPLVSRHPESRIAIGDCCVLCSHPAYTALGVNHAVVLRTLRTGAQILIGPGTGISGGSICAAVKVSIGRDVLIGANVTISDTDFHPVDPSRRLLNAAENDVRCAAVEIGNNVFIGTGSIILKGVRIGDNAVIGAGSVVSRSVPANAIAVGNPARVVASAEHQEAPPTSAALFDIGAGR